MSSELTALLSVAYHEPGDEHLVELVHQQDLAAPRRLASLALDVYASDGRRLDRVEIDPARDVLDLGDALAKYTGATNRFMVAFDARYDEKAFPHFRPHHYAFVRRPGSSAPPVYCAVNSVLGGFASGTSAVRLHNFETYLFARRPLPQRYSLLLGNLSRFVPAEAQVVSHFGAERRTREVTIAPRAHVEVELESASDGAPLRRVDLKSLFRLANYVVARAPSGEIALLDHLFGYLK
jgi:hypothetical protein